MIAVALVCGLGLAGCGQADLSKSVSNRTTVKTSGSFTDEMLRTIDPCQLLNDDVANTVGKKTSFTTDLRSYSECGLSIKDTTGKFDLGMTVKIGASLFSAPKQGGKQINGLSVYESQTDSGCTEDAVTGRAPDRGITVRVVGEGAAPLCAASAKLMDLTIKRLASDPPRYDIPAGSLVGLDPCADLDDDTAASVLGSTPKKTPNGIRICILEGKDVDVYVRHDIGEDPFTYYSSNKPTKVDLTDKVKGAAQFKDSVEPNKCQIEWVHRKLTGNRTENVNVSFERQPPQQGEDPCAKILPAAKAIATKVTTT
jgi:hypothetical protein